MRKENGKTPLDEFRTGVAEYALLTVLASLALMVGMAFLRFGTG